MSICTDFSARKSIVKIQTFKNRSIYFPVFVTASASLLLHFTALNLFELVLYQVEFLSCENPTSAIPECFCCETENSSS